MVDMKLKKPKPGTVRDLHVYGGALVACAGLSLAWPPLGAVGFGAFMATLGLFWGRKRT